MLAFAARSRSVSRLERIGVTMWVVPTLASGTVARSTSAPLAWARFTWCVPARYLRSDRVPGAWTPSRWPTTRKLHGSLKTIQSLTRSPRRSATTPTYSSNQPTTLRFAQPPWSWSTWGRSQWYRVTQGATLRSRQASTTRS